MLKSLTCAICFAFISVSSLGVSAIELVEDVTNSDSETSLCETKVKFYIDFADAFDIAKRTSKPLFVLQLSGDLKNATFT